MGKIKVTKLNQTSIFREQVETQEESFLLCLVQGGSREGCMN